MKPTKSREMRAACGTCDMDKTFQLENMHGRQHLIDQGVEGQIPH
jgi:hypothetical protein